MQELVINKDVVRGIAVPNYSNATKEQSAMVFITNRYYRIYFSIIEKAKTRTLPKNTYKERHHIIPRSLGGDDSPENLVDLTAREHFICHKLLMRITEGEARGKMSFAVVLMAGKLGSRVYETTKKILADTTSKLHKGKIPITNGVVDKTLLKGQVMPDGFYPGFSPETLKKHGDGNKGKCWITNGAISYQPKDGIVPEGFWYGQADYHKQKNSDANKGDKNPNFGKHFITDGKQNQTIQQGDTIPEGWYYGKVEKKGEAKSLSKKGANNPNYGRPALNSKTVTYKGVTYTSYAEAVRITGVSRQTIKKHKGK